MLMDSLSKQARSKLMGSVRQRSNTPWLILLRELHHMGFRFRLNVRSLPSSPDIVLRKWNAAILVHGCFWPDH